MTNLEKLAALHGAIHESDLSPVVKEMLLSQLRVIEDMCDDYSSSLFDSERLFEKGFLIGAIRMLNAELVPMFQSISLWINSDELITELEAGDGEPASEIPLFSGTMDALDRLTTIRKGDES